MIDYEQIIKEAAQIPETALIKTLGIAPETGSTSLSLKNFKTIMENPLDFKCFKITFDFDKRHPRLQTKWIGKGKQELSWDFSGFNAGYLGEGPRGLMKVLKTLGFKDWDSKTIQNLENGTYQIL